MAGDLAWFNYSTDDEDAYAFFMDVSNAAVVGNTAIVAGDLPISGLPRNITPRVANYLSADGQISRRVVVGSTTQIATLPATASFEAVGGAVSLSLSSVTGERVRRVRV